MRSEWKWRWKLVINHLLVVALLLLDTQSFATNVVCVCTHSQWMSVRASRRKTSAWWNGIGQQWKAKKIWSYRHAACSDLSLNYTFNLWTSHYLCSCCFGRVELWAFLSWQKNFHLAGKNEKEGTCKKKNRKAREDMKDVVGKISSSQWRALHSCGFCFYSFLPLQPHSSPHLSRRKT